MVKRGLGYFSSVLFREYFVGAPGILLEAALRWYCPSEMVNGIRVIDPAQETRTFFRNVVGDAMALVVSIDSVRSKRIQQEIRTVVNAPAIWATSYGRPLRVCSMDLRCFYEPADPQMTKWFFASGLVREATHRHLLSRGVLRTQQNRLRFDGLCCKEAQRFMRRLGLTKTPWDPEFLLTTSAGLFWNRAVKELYGALVRDSAAEAALWKRAEKNNRGSHLDIGHDK